MFFYFPSLISIPSGTVTIIKRKAAIGLSHPPVLPVRLDSR